MKNAPIIAILLALASTPALAANADFSCGGSKLMARGTLFITYAVANEGQQLKTGDDSYDSKLIEGVNRKFGNEDFTLTLKYLQDKPNAGKALVDKVADLRSKKYRGSRLMYELVNFFLDPKNDLCQK